MRKKLIRLICLAAVMMLGAQFVSAQNVTAIEPTSPTSFATNGRFRSDVDLFMHVNDWANVQMDKWFGYVGAVDVNTPDNIQGGLALKLSKAYLGLYYYGRYNTGNLAEGTITSVDGNDVDTTVTLGPGNTVTGVIPGAGNQHRNYFGVLLGVGNHGFKFTLLDNLWEANFAVKSVAGLIDSDGNAVSPGSIGYYKGRTGTVTPKLWWGAAQPMQLGKFSTRPNAYVELAVNYANEVEWGFDNDNYHYENFSANSLNPKLGVDTGSITFFEGDWGKFTGGLLEEITVGIRGEGYDPVTGDPYSLNWENQLKPYVGFSYSPAEYFKMAARVDVPLWFGWDGGTGNFFGIGAKGQGVTAAGQKAATLRTGFQLNCGFFDKVTEKIGILDKMNFNFGIAINLPGYLYTETNYDYNVTGEDYPHDTIVISKNPRQEWFSDVANVLQSVSTGISFAITPNVILDWTIAGTQNVLSNSVLLSLKH